MILIFHNDNSSLLWDLIEQIKDKYNILMATNNRGKIDKIKFLIDRLFLFDDALKIKIIDRESISKIFPEVGNIFYMVVGYSPCITSINFNNFSKQVCKFNYFYGYFSPLINPLEFIQLLRDYNNISSGEYHITSSSSTIKNSRNVFINNQLLTLLKSYNTTLKINDKDKNLELKIILEEYKRFKNSRINSFNHSSQEINFQEYNKLLKIRNIISQEQKLQIKKYFLADSYGIKQSDITSKFIEKYDKFVPQFKGITHAFQFKNNPEDFQKDLRDKLGLTPRCGPWVNLDKKSKREYGKRLISIEILDILGFENGVFDPIRIPKDYFFIRFNDLFKYLIINSNKIDNIFQNYHPIKWSEKMEEWERERPGIIKSMLIYINSKLSSTFKIKIIHNNTRDRYRHYFISGLEFWNEIKKF